MKSQVLNELCEVVSRRSFKAPSTIKQYIRGMTECRTTRYGGRVVQCSDCGKTQVLYNSCNKRGCPICYRHRQKQWESHVRVRILHTSHFHLIFSIPEAYTNVWLLHKKEVMNAFFESVKKAIGKISSEYGITPGCVASFQTHARGMAYKPHIHCALTDGGVIGKKAEWVRLGSISYTMLRDVVKQTFDKHLRRLLKTNLEDLPKENEIDDRGWSVYGTYSKGDAEHIIGYMAHVSTGTVINLNKGITIDTEKGTIRFSERHGEHVVETELRKEVFCERYLNHIPVKHTVTVRYYGLYSNDYSSVLYKLQEQFPGSEYEEPEWTDTCPVCHKPMVVVKLLDPYEEPMPLEYYEKHRVPA